MKITALVENTRLEGRNDLTAEKGLSLYIQSGEHKILFDSGISAAFGRNAGQLGIDIREADLMVLSHHHFDHGGGLAHFLKRNPKAQVYLRGIKGGDYYLRLFGIINKYVGLDKSLFEMYPGRFEFIDKFTEIAPGVFILSDIGKRHPRPKGNRMLLVKEGKSWRPDPFEHELILAIQEKEGLTVFTGCSHGGILNMVETVSKQFQGIPIRAVIGGFHQMSLPMLNTMAGSKVEVEDIGQTMLSYSIEKVYTCHCTGLKAYRILKQVMGEKLGYLSTGSSIEV